MAFKRPYAVKDEPRDTPCVLPSLHELFGGPHQSSAFLGTPALCMLNPLPHTQHSPSNQRYSLPDLLIRSRLDSAEPKPPPFCAPIATSTSEQRPAPQRKVPVAWAKPRAPSPPRQDSHSSDASSGSCFSEMGSVEDDGVWAPKKRARANSERWLPGDDEKLRRAYHEWQSVSPKGLCPWRKLAAKISGGHSSAQCGTNCRCPSILNIAAQRWRRVLRPELKKGPWIVEDEERLITLVAKIGERWARVSNAMEDRSDIQCRYWFRKLLQMGSGGWTHADDQTLRRLHSELGNRWELIAKEMETGTRRRSPSASACLARVLLVWKK